VKNPEWNNNLGDSKLKMGILEESNKVNVLEYHYYPTVSLFSPCDILFP
jgi:hypothetical protein